VNLKTIAGHTIDTDLLNGPLPFVLDVGCRGFDFTQGILELNPHANIIALDPDPVIEDPRLARVHYVRKALVHDDRKEYGYASYSTGEGNFLTNQKSYYDAKMIRVPCTNIVEVMAEQNITHWDLVKLDCEGSEFDILTHWPGPIATQISVEFHDGHPDEYSSTRESYRKYYEELWERLRPYGYQVVQHELFKQGNWYGHWDTLLCRLQG
jgi:FkbM family methyltransferase